jgi:hypothetical protein
MSLDCDNWGHIPQIEKKTTIRYATIRQMKMPNKESGAIRAPVSTLVGSGPLHLLLVVGAGPSQGTVEATAPGRSESS